MHAPPRISSAEPRRRECRGSMCATIDRALRQAAARPRASPRPARSGFRSRPARRTRRSRARGVEAVDRQPVGREAPEARPAPLDPLDRPVDHLLETVDRGRDVDLLRRRVARIGRDLVVRAEPDDAVALALEIEGAGGVIDQRQIPAGPSGRRGAGPSFAAWARCRAAERRTLRRRGSAQAPAASTRIEQRDRRSRPRARPTSARRRTSRARASAESQRPRRRAC